MCSPPVYFGQLPEVRPARSARVSLGRKVDPEVTDCEQISPNLWTSCRLELDYAQVGVAGRIVNLTRLFFEFVLAQ